MFLISTNFLNLFNYFIFLGYRTSFRIKFLKYLFFEYLEKKSIYLDNTSIIDFD